MSKVMSWSAFRAGHLALALAITAGLGFLFIQQTVYAQKEGFLC